MKKKNILILFFTIILGICYGLFFDNLNITIPCLFHKITGLYCPGCGITRMFVSLLHFRIKEAFFYNQLVFCLLPLFFILLIDYILIKCKKIGFINNKLKHNIWMFILVASIIFGILRNIPYFSFLRP